MSTIENRVLLEGKTQSFMEAAIAQTELGLADSSSTSLPKMDGLAICKVIGFQDGVPWINFEVGGIGYTHKAIAVVCGSNEIDVGSQVCAAFDQNRLDRPVILGKFSCDLGNRLSSGIGTVIADEDQLTLKCGKASINLKSDGTVAIRGTNVASRATQTNRIRGGNVQIN